MVVTFYVGDGDLLILKEATPVLVCIPMIIIRRSLRRALAFLVDGACCLCTLLDVPWGSPVERAESL